MTIAYVGFGSNQGDSQAFFEKIRDEIDQSRGTRVMAVSPAYKSAPLDVPDRQPDYLNAVLQIETALAPLSILEMLQGIEDSNGRQRGSMRNLARTVDLDLLLVGDLTLNTPALTLPHPRIYQRAFVLYPLHDLSPGLEVPGQGIVKEMLDNVRDQEIIRL